MISSTRESAKMHRHCRAARENLWLGEHSTSTNESRNRRGSICLSAAFPFPSRTGLEPSAAKRTAKCWQTWTMNESRRLRERLLGSEEASALAGRDSVRSGSVLRETKVDSRLLKTSCSARSCITVFTPTSPT